MANNFEQGIEAAILHEIKARVETMANEEYEKATARVRDRIRAEVAAIVVAIHSTVEVTRQEHSIVVRIQDKRDAKP